MKTLTHSGFVLLLLFPIVTSHSQEAPAKPSEIAPAQAAAPPELVRIFFSVVDKHGDPVAGVSKDDLVVLDDKQPVTISEFRPVSDDPVSCALLLDLSGSSEKYKKLIKEAALQTFDALSKANARCVGVVFADRVGIVPDISRKELEGSLDKAVYKGGTALYDAIDLTCREVFKGKPASGFGRRAIVVITDGDDNRSGDPRSYAIEAARESGVTIYALGAFSKASTKRGKRNLWELTESTGGTLAAIEDSSRFADYLLQALRSQYVLVYSPLEVRRDGRFRKVEIKLPNRRDLKVVAGEGYYSGSTKPKRESP